MEEDLLRLAAHVVNKLKLKCGAAADDGSVQQQPQQLAAADSCTVQNGMTVSCKILLALCRASREHCSALELSCILRVLSNVA